MDSPKHSAGLTERELFVQALDQATPAERAAYLDAACGNDSALRRRIELLLERFAEVDTFLEKPVVSISTANRAEMSAAEIRPNLVVQVQPTEDLGTVIGRYKLLQKIGEGGMGVVYMAEQEEPVRRRVALKIIKLGMDTKSVIARFEAERQALAMMDHPNIAKVLDGGATDAGRPYFVMELVRGIKITEYCDEAKLSTRDRLDLFIKVCQAIQHAHQKGIIHRDIKPSNILVTINDGVAVPKVIDFGIAKATEGRLTDKTLFTQFEAFIGTPAYVSPEQAVMTSLDIDTRSDIYSLGVLLYELLVGSTPFDAKDLMASGIDAMRKTIREQEPLRPSTKLSQTLAAANPHSKLATLHSSLPTDLDWIVMKCLEKDRSRRYETANGLASDLQRHLNNEAVLARPPSAAYRFQKLVRRNKVAFAATTAIATVLVIGVIVSTWQAIRATRAQQKALNSQENETRQRALVVEALARARIQEHLSSQLRYDAEMALAFESLSSDNLGRARALLAKQLPRGESKTERWEAEVDRRGWEWRHLWNRTRGDKHAALTGHSNEVTGAVFLNDGRTIVSAGADNRLRLWDIEQRANTQTIPLAESGDHCLTLSPDGHWLAVGGDPWQLFDTARWQQTSTGTNSVRGETFAFSDDNQLLAFISGPNIRVLDVASGQMLSAIRRSGDQWEDADRVGLAFSPDGQQLAYSNPDQTVRLYNLLEHTQLIVRPARPVLGVVFSRDGKFVITGGKGGIEVWDRVTGTIIERLAGHHDEVTAVTVSPDGRFLASSSVDQTVRLWETASWKAIKTFRAHEMAVVSVAFSNDGKRLVSAGRDERVRVWNLQDLTLREDTYVSADNAPFSWPFAHGNQVALVHGNLPYAPASLPLSNRIRETLRLQGNHGAVSYLNCVTLEESLSESTPPSFSSAQVMAFGFDARSVALGWPDGHIEFWMTQPFRQLRTFGKSTNAPIHLAVSANGEKMSIHRADDTVEIWNPVTGILERRLPVLGNLFVGPNCGFWAHDRILARFSGGWEHSPPVIELWSLPEGRRRVFAHPKGGLWTQAISNDGRLLATSGWDGVLRIWDVEREQQIETIAGQLKTYYSLVFSPDDSRLVGGGYDGTITMWDLTTRQQVAHWKAHDRECAWLRFVGKNEDLVSLGNLNNADRHQGDIRLWRAPSLSEIDATEASP